MKAVMSSVPPDIAEWRRVSGADRWDEVWEGVLHMGPSPDSDHQDFEGALEAYLRFHWARLTRGRIFHCLNLSSGGDWKKNYRIPDLMLLKAGCRAVVHKQYIQGPPDVVVEIRSPDDESLEKLPFYAALGVGEVWMFERDSKAPSLYLLQKGEYLVKQPQSDGWNLSEAIGVEFRVLRPGKLTMRLRGDAASEEDLP